MELSFGEHIRQLRRKKGLTQTELGATRFSKSYVSAVERGQIFPSHDGLCFFAEQFEQSVEDLEQLLEQSQKTISISPRAGFDLSQVGGYNDLEIVDLLDFVLHGKALNARSIEVDYSTELLDPASILLLQKHARYAFLKGLIAQEEADFSSAHEALEYALVLAPHEYKPAILDALGTNAYQVQAYEQAIIYYLRAHHLALKQTSSSGLCFQIELHCGNAYRELGKHQHACGYYELARKRLRSTHNMQVAGQLYLGLGYSMYATLYQAGGSVSITSLTPKMIERHFEHALSFLLQSKTLYQIGSDVRGETQARLTQAMVLLDLCAWRQQQALGKRHPHAHPIIVNCSALLDEIDEQCRQVLVSFLEKYQVLIHATMEQKSTLYLALAYLIRSLCRRATVARLGCYTDTAVRELSLAHLLCQKVLSALQDNSLSWDLINDAIKWSGHNATANVPSILHLPDLSCTEISTSYAFMLTEIYFVAGEVSEEIGRTATKQEFARDCYTTTDHCFAHIQLLEDGIRQISDISYDPGYQTRLYQRYVGILAQRLDHSPIKDETTQTLLTLLQTTLVRMQRPVPLVDIGRTFKNATSTI